MIAPVRVEPARVMRAMVGLRPFRPDGFVVRAEHRRDKDIVHHYGHGGCGISLSWGTARMVVDLARGRGPARAAVVGCGAVGLATARSLQESGVAVTIHAAALPPHTTSSMAGAFWAPFSLVDAERITPAFARALGDASRESHRAFSALAGDARYGVHPLPLYHLGAQPPVLTPEMSAAPELFDGPLLAPGDHPFGERYARRLAGMAIEPARYLAALLEDFLRAGGVIVEHTLASPRELAALDAPLVVDCAGLGARTLAGDASLVPLKGQLLLLEPQPEIDYMVVAPEEGLYMLPRRDAIVLGTSHQRGEWSNAPDPAETQRILDGHRALFGAAAAEEMQPAATNA